LRSRINLFDNGLVEYVPQTSERGDTLPMVLTVGRAGRVRTPLHWVPLSLCVCRALLAIVDDDEEIEQDGVLVRVKGITGHRG
jgi:hypothetical protein